MSKVIVDGFVTLDGVVQALSYPDEDEAGGFEHGGWHARYLNELPMGWVVDNVRGAGGYLLGRGTYGALAGCLRGRTRARGVVEHAPEVRRIDDAGRAARMAQRDPAPGRRQ